MVDTESHVPCTWSTWKLVKVVLNYMYAFQSTKVFFKKSTLHLFFYLFIHTVCYMDSPPKPYPFVCFLCAPYLVSWLSYIDIFGYSDFLTNPLAFLHTVTYLLLSHESKLATLCFYYYMQVCTYIFGLWALHRLGP